MAEKQSIIYKNMQTTMKSKPQVKVLEKQKRCNKESKFNFYKFFNKWFNNMRGFYFKKLGVFLLKNPKISAAIESSLAKILRPSRLLGSF